MTVRDDDMPFAHLAIAVEVSSLSLTLTHTHIHSHTLSHTHTHTHTHTLSLSLSHTHTHTHTHSLTHSSCTHIHLVFFQGCGWSNPDYIPLMIAGAVSLSHPLVKHCVYNVYMTTVLLCVFRSLGTMIGQSVEDITWPVN